MAIVNRFLSLLVSGLFTGLLAQVPAPVSTPAGPVSNTEQNLNNLRATYVLGTGDEMVVRVLEMEDLTERIVMVDGDGNITLPLLGSIRAAGVTVQSFQASLVEQLKKYVREPHVTVTVVRFRSEQVFFVGGFRAPGIHGLQSRRMLSDMLAMVGGLQPTASRRIRVSRRKDAGVIPSPRARQTAEGMVVSVPVNGGGSEINAADDFKLEPYDVVTADRAEPVYATGGLLRPGVIEVGERDSLTISQVLSLSGGLSRDADADKARVLRPVMDTNRRAEIPVNVKRILQGQDADFPLLPNDILHIPERRAGKGRNLTRQVLVYGLPVATSLALVAFR